MPIASLKEKIEAKGATTMKKATIEGMELGNLAFGHSRGQYAIERHLYEDDFHDFLERIRFDGYGRPETDELAKELGFDEEFENDVFVIRPYYWGDDEETADLPNFVHKPSGTEIRWYKYALRDAYCSRDLTVAQFKAMLDECARSMGK